MATIKCPKCDHGFDFNNAESLLTRGVVATLLAGGGAMIGARLGIAGGPWGAAAGTVPGALIGALAGWFTADQFRRCPKCGEIFKT